MTVDAAAVLRQHRQAILARWPEPGRSAGTATSPLIALRPGLQTWLDQLTRWLDAGAVGTFAPPDLDFSRLPRDIDLRQLLTEYRLLRTHLHDLLLQAGSTEVEIASVDAAIDDSTASSVEALAEARTAAHGGSETRAIDAEASQRRAEARATRAETDQRTAEHRRVEAEGQQRLAANRADAADLRADAAILRAADAERVGAEAELFMGVLGHDLRNPLAAIVTATSVLLRRGLMPADARVVAAIARGGDRMTRMIDQLLDFTRIRLGGGLQLKKSEMDLHKVLREVVEELELARPERSIRLVATGAVTGAWDGDRLGQVISNLLGNALEHSPPETAVEVHLRADPTGATISFQNEGPPIPPQLMKSLYDPFRRGERSSQGLGLGLYIAQEITHSHGGTVEVVSDESGTIFTVRLPRS